MPCVFRGRSVCIVVWGCACTIKAPFVCSKVCMIMYEESFSFHSLIWNFHICRDVTAVMWDELCVQLCVSVRWGQWCVPFASQTRASGALVQASASISRSSLTPPQHSALPSDVSMSSSAQSSAGGCMKKSTAPTILGFCMGNLARP